LFLTVFTLNAQIIQNGLLGYYPFDGNANDLSTFGAHGEVHSAQLVEGINGLPNACYEFENSYISVDSLTKISDTSFTISVWLYGDSTLQQD